jgi:hypothetical protein
VIFGFFSISKQIYHVSPHQVSVEKGGLAEHSSSSEIACLSLASNTSFLSSDMVDTATAGASVTIPLGNVAGFRISSIND